MKILYLEIGMPKTKIVHIKVLVLIIVNDKKNLSDKVVETGSVVKICT